MASLRKTESCKVNGAKAAGARSPEGIERAKMNALKHGITARALVLPGESSDMFDEFAASLRDELNPQSPIQHILVNDIIGAAWRQRRYLVFETNAIAHTTEEMRTEVDRKHKDPSPSLRATLAFQSLVKDGQFAVFTRYEAHLNRQFHRALKAIQNLPIPPAGEVPPNDANPEIEHEEVQPTEQGQPQPELAPIPMFLAETKATAAGRSFEGFEEVQPSSTSPRPPQAPTTDN